MKHLAVPAFFLCLLAGASARATSNQVVGTAYGTNYTALATAPSIASVAAGSGWIVIGYSGTTNLALNHAITGIVAITNATPGFTVQANAATVTGSDTAAFGALGSTNLTITGGHFIGTVGSGTSLFPPWPGEALSTTGTSSAVGGRLKNSTATIDGTEFAGASGRNGLVLENSTVVISNGIFRGGSVGTGGYGGAGLFASSNSLVEIHAGSFTGQVGNTAFFLKDGDTTVYGGTFVGNVGGSSNAPVAGDGLFSQATTAATNTVSLYGGTFSSLAFYGVDASVQQLLVGTNLTVQNGIIQNGGTVLVDNQSDTALQNITLFNGTLELANDFTLGANGTLVLHRGQLNATGNLLFETDSSLALDLGTNGYATVMAGSATFQSNAVIDIKVSSAVLSSGTNNIDVLTTTGGIFVDDGGATNTATTATFNSTVAATVETDWLTLFNGLFIDGGNTLRVQLLTQTWGSAWGAEGPLKNLANELEALDGGGMAAIVSTSGATASKAATENTYFTTMNTFQTAMQGLGAAVGQSLSRGTEFREQLRLVPAGAKGPEQNNDIRGWFKTYGQFLTHDQQGLNTAYDTSLYGGTFGADTSLGNLLLGISGGEGHYTTTDDNDGQEDIEAFHGALYGTYGTDRAFIDAGVAYGYNQVEKTSAQPFVLNGAFDAQIVSAYLGAGYDLVDTPGGTVFTPEASIQYSSYEQEAYTETSTVAVPRNIEAFDADSLRSSLGLNVSMLEPKNLTTFGFKVEGRFHWLHEFNPEPGNLRFSLAGGANDYELAYPSLDEDFFRAGIGLSCFNTLSQKPKNVMLRLDFDELFNQDFNSHNFSAKVIYAF